jgi:hypothetical protein
MQSSIDSFQQRKTRIRHIQIKATIFLKISMQTYKYFFYTNMND